MKFKKLIVTNIDDEIIEIKLNDPKLHNALSPNLILELNECIKEISENKNTKIVIFSSTGNSFCAGGDLAWMKRQITSSRSDRIKEASKLADLLFNIYNCPKPIIAKVEGNAFGGGVGIMSVCDFVFTTNNIKLALTEAKLGLIPATISPYVVKKIGEKNSINLFTSARFFFPKEGLEMGLIDRVCSPNSINETIKKFIMNFMRNSPNAIFESKKLVKELSNKIDKEIVDFTIEKLADIWETEEAKEGINAFFNKSKPYWYKEN